MKLNSKIYIAGHRGLVGSALMRQLETKGYTNIISRTHAQLDLCDQVSVANFFKKENPEFVILAAAKSGGIHANNTYPADFILENLAIQTNVIHQSYLFGVKRLLFLGSSCIYPRDCDQPIKEEYLLMGKLEATNRPYALAKIVGIEMCWSYNRQFGTKYLAVMPTNLYGIGDNYHSENSHVIPALIRKFHDAKINNEPNVYVWGSGTPRREFLFSDDMAEACLFIMNLSDELFNSMLASDRNDGLPPLLNISQGTDVSIAELAALIKEVVNYQGGILFDKSKPDGVSRKLMDPSRLNTLGWRDIVDLKSGIKIAYEDFEKSEKLRM